jgi:hypothetical protein
VVVRQNGADDYDLEICYHCKKYEKITSGKGEMSDRTNGLYNKERVFA